MRRCISHRNPLANMCLNGQIRVNTITSEKVRVHLGDKKKTEKNIGPL